MEPPFWRSAFYAGRNGSGVLLSPGAQRLQHRAEGFSFFRQVVLEPGRMLAVELALDEPGGFHVLQTRGEGVGRDAPQRFLQILVAPRPLAEKIAQDQRRPAL